MSTVQELEQERQAILERMQMRRESYRRMLADGEDFRKVSLSPEQGPDGNGRTHDHRHHFAKADGAHGNAVYTYSSIPGPSTRVMQVVTEHPVLVALGVAAVLAIGPRRIVRTVANSRAALTAVGTDQQSMAMLGRIMELAGTFAQRRR